MQQAITSEHCVNHKKRNGLVDGEIEVVEDELITKIKL
jgi:hypothetical protein